MGRVQSSQASIGPVEYLARPLTLIAWGFWIVALDLSFHAGGYALDIINDAVGYVLLIAGMLALRAASASIVPDSRAAPRFVLALGLAIPGLALALAQLVPGMRAWTPPVIVSVGALTDTLCGAALLAGLALACDAARAPPVAQSWRLSSRLWLWVFLPVNLIVLLVVADGGSVMLTGAVGVAVIIVWLCVALVPVMHAHVSMVRTRRWHTRFVTHCPACGYSLMGLPGPNCPECGLGFDSMGGPVVT